jgi:CRP-like cAMP-binding protein
LGHAGEQPTTVSFTGRIVSEIGRAAAGEAVPVYNSAVAKASPEMLKQVPLFADLDARELGQIAASMRERRFAAGDTVTQEGAGGAGFFVVESGEAEVTVDGAARGTIGPSDYFGEIALLTGSDRTATITATSDMVCYGMTPWDFRPLVESNSAIAWKLLTAMAEKLR